MTKLTNEELTAIAQVLAKVTGNTAIFPTSFSASGPLNPRPMISNAAFQRQLALFAAPRPSVQVVDPNRLLLLDAPKQAAPEEKDDAFYFDEIYDAEDFDLAVAAQIEAAYQKEEDDDLYRAYDDFDSAATGQVNAAEFPLDDVRDPDIPDVPEVSDYSDFAYNHTTYKSFEGSAEALGKNPLQTAKASKDHEPIKPVPDVRDKPQGFVKTQVRKIDDSVRVQQEFKAAMAQQRASSPAKAAPESPKGVRDVHDNQNDDDGFKP